MAIYHTYASNDDLREYLAGTSYSSNWSSDTNIIARILETSSKRIDAYMGMRSFGIRIDTRYFDIGAGALKQSQQNFYDTSGTYALGPSSSMMNSIVFDDWLYNPTTVTAYKQTARTENETLTEGYNADYWLLPYNQYPKVQMTLNEDTSKSLYSGQQTLSITGEWGYSKETVEQTTLDGGISASDTTVSVASASGLSASQTVLVADEQMYITGISTNDLTVVRGVNGTTAAIHLTGVTVETFTYPSLVVQACLDIAKIYYRDRDLGVTNTLGGDVPITTASNEQRGILHSLDEYRAQAPNSVVFF